MKARETAPTKTTVHSDPQCYKVWANDPVYIEDPRPWKCVAMFQYLNECLDYIAYCQDRGSDVVFQSPADVKLVRATESRVVWKPEQERIA